MRNISQLYEVTEDKDYVEGLVLYASGWRPVSWKLEKWKQESKLQRPVGAPCFKGHVGAFYVRKNCLRLNKENYMNKLLNKLHRK